MTNLLTNPPQTGEHPIPDPTLPSNLYAADGHLQLALAYYLREDPASLQWANNRLSEWGATCSQQIDPLVAEADRHGPTLRQFDRRGERIDEVEFHPAYHQIGRLAYGNGLTNMANVPGFRGYPGKVPQLIKTAGYYVYSQVEEAISCPISMTDTLARVLTMFAGPELVERYLPHLTSLDYDQLYTGAMFMTEKVGGSDVGATTTQAQRAEDGSWRLSGDKWFCSNVSADLILTLARPVGGPTGTRGLGLFLVPKTLPDGRRNSYVINRLKDKLGTRAMASGEVTFQDTFAYLIEPLERGFVMMMEMVNCTRLGCGMGGAAALRRAVIEAVQHTQARQAFGRSLAEQPLVAEELANLIVDSQAATSLMLEAAHRLDRADASRDNTDRIISRLLISLVKRYATDHGVAGAQKAMELRGGNGYIEDWPNARLLRDAYVQIIWEGGVNMVSFDVLRTLEREGAWPVYARTLETELANAPAGVLTAHLHSDLENLSHAVESLLGQDRAAREIAAPTLAEAMAALYAAVLLAAQAGFSQQRDPANTRPLLAARRYRERFVQPTLQTLQSHLTTPHPAEASDLIGGALN